MQYIVTQERLLASSDSNGQSEVVLGKYELDKGEGGAAKAVALAYLARPDSHLNGPVTVYSTTGEATFEITPTVEVTRIKEDEELQDV